MWRFVGLFSLAGVGTPIFFLGFWWGLNKIGVEPHFFLTFKLETIQTLIWPSSFFLMATEGQTLQATIQVILLSVAVNVLLYTLIGALIWYGINKRLWVLFILAGLVALGWYELLSL